MITIHFYDSGLDFPDCAFYYNKSSCGQAAASKSNIYDV